MRLETSGNTQLEILNKLQKEILNIFGEVPDSENFYLTGGTALAGFYLFHRRSNDLDFFTDKEELIIPFSYNLEGSLKSQNINIKRQRSFNSFVELFTEKNNESMVIHIAQDTPFRLEDTKIFSEYPKLRIDSFADITANKLLALFGRATLRDFLDVYFIVEKWKINAEELLEKAKMKDPGFDLYWLVVAFERINTFKEDSPEMFLLIETIDFKQLLIFFNQWRENITKQLF